MSNSAKNDKTIGGRWRLDRYHQNCVLHGLEISKFRRKMAVFGDSGGSAAVFSMLGVDTFLKKNNPLSSKLRLI